IEQRGRREEISDHAGATLEELSPVVDATRLLNLIEGTSEVEATIKWASNKKLHLEIALIRAIQALSEVGLENVIDALENLRGESSPASAKEIKIAPVAERRPTQESELAAPKTDAGVAPLVGKDEKAAS